MGGSFWPLAWQPRTTVKADFLFPVVRIDTVLVPVFSTVRFTWMSNVRGTLSMLAMCCGSALVLAVGAENGQLLIVILWRLLQDGSSCPNGEITPFHETGAPRRTSSKVFYLHVTCYHYCLESNRDRRDASTCYSLFNKPTVQFCSLTVAISLCSLENFVWSSLLGAGHLLSSSTSLPLIHLY